VRLRFLVPLAVFIALVVGLFAGLWLRPSELPSALIDKEAPEIELPPIAGLDGVSGLATGDFRGTVTVLNVFASWCIPCRAEAPELKRLAGDPAFRGRIHLVGINYKDKPGDARRFLQELGDPYERIGADTSGRAAIEWGVYGVPETFLIDARGRIRLRLPAPITDDEYDKTIKPALRAILAEAGKSEAAK
jgi:cytochrome c biogenesis protein CcmG/thiol:disulfide interchange protein DsbE